MSVAAHHKHHRAVVQHIVEVRLQGLFGLAYSGAAFRIQHVAGVAEGAPRLAGQRI